MDRKPTAAPRPLLLVGAHKAGTSSVYSALGHHPAVWAPEPKEPGWFALGDPANRAAAESYRSRRTSAPPSARYWMDGSTSTAQTVRYPHALGRAVTELGTDVRVLYLLRDPLERMRSAYVQLRSELLNDLPRDLGTAMDRLVEPTLYLTHYEALAATFGADRVHLALLEDFRSDPDTVLEQVQKWLDLDQVRLPTMHENAGGERRQSGRLLQRATSAPASRRVLAAATDRLPARFTESVRRRLTTPVERPEITPEDVGPAWPRLEREARAILEIIGRDPSVWPSLR